MDVQGIFDALLPRFGEAVFGFTAAVPREIKDPKEAAPRDAFFKVKAERLVEVMAALRDDPALRFDFLQNLTAIDWLKDGRIDVVYHLYSYPHRHEIAVKVELPRANPRVASVTALWRCADWLEREQFDLLGVVFDGHPDLRRLLLPDDWVGHPMRKDYHEASEYRGMPTTRPSPMDLLLTYDKANPSGPTPPGKPGGASS